MRVIQGRGDWRPGCRIESLRRYAFIGDSHAYGAGVAPDQTLSANAERQMNELWPAWPVEAVNLGLSGYNLWNSWLAFKRAPQVYDGVVLALCNNDADFFGRSYHVSYPEPHETRWEDTHPCGQAVARCFDDIAAFSKEQGLPVAVIYFNSLGTQGQMRVGEIIGALCVSRGLCFIDTLFHYRDRNLARADLIVSAVDFHPSATAHEAVGRHLAATLRRHGWFGEYDTSAIGAAPDRILESAKAMVEADHYPPDAALNWALRVLDAKSRLARRIQAAGADADDHFSTKAAAVAEVLTTASRRWHLANRLRAFMGEVAIGGQGIVTGLWRAEEEKLRLEELGFALGMGDWNGLTARLVEVDPPRPTAPEGWSSEVPGFLDGCSQDLMRLGDALDGLRGCAVPAAVGGPHDEALMLADLDALSRLAERAQAECAALKAAFLSFENILGDARPSLSEAQIAHVSSLLGARFGQVKDVLGFVRRWAAAIERIGVADCASFTTIEVTLRGEVIDGRPVCILSGQAEYSVPNRLPFADSGSFWSDGSSMLVKLRVPLLYAGRLLLRPYNSKPSDKPIVEATLIKVEVYNGKNQRRIVEPAAFYKDHAGRFVSPLIYLP
jgi:hypothetical protein